jgi:hypothetical protein
MYTRAYKLELRRIRKAIDAEIRTRKAEMKTLFREGKTEAASGVQYRLTNSRQTAHTLHIAHHLIRNNLDKIAPSWAKDTVKHAQEIAYVNLVLKNTMHQFKEPESETVGSTEDVRGSSVQAEFSSEGSAGDPCCGGDLPVGSTDTKERESLEQSHAGVRGSTGPAVSECAVHVGESGESPVRNFLRRIFS